ncbi:MAG: trigger factor [Eubacterium sp.]|nr:trigger factor [Eubacterium sp.]
MSVKVEDLEEKFMKKLTVEVPAEEFDAAVKKVYQRQRKSITVPGFRKGKAPQFMIEKMYGESIFFEDAANDILPDAYEKAAKESGLDIVSRPEIDVTEIGHGKNFVFTASVAVRPDVELGQYKGVEVPKFDTTVTDDDVQEALEREQKKDGRTVEVTDRPVEKDDTANIDYEGKIDGVPFDGGKDEGHDLKIGSNSFIPGFEDQVIGMNVGETKDITVTFPEDYHAEDLKGKEAVFTVKVNKVTATELPELDDEYAADKGFDTLDAYKESLRKELQERKDSQAKQSRRDNGLSKAAQNAKIDMPEAMINSEADEMVNNFARQLQAQGMSIDQYMQYTGADMDGLRAQVRPQAVMNLRNRLTMEKIAEVENIGVSDEELDKEFENMAKSYNMEAEKIKEIMGDEEKAQMKKDLQVQKAIDFVADNAIEVEKTEEEKTEEASEEKTEE